VCDRTISTRLLAYSRFVIRDSRFVAIHENSLSNRTDPNDE